MQIAQNYRIDEMNVIWNIFAISHAVSNFRVYIEDFLPISHGFVI